MMGSVDFTMGFLVCGVAALALIFTMGVGVASFVATRRHNRSTRH